MVNGTSRAGLAGCLMLCILLAGGSGAWASSDVRLADAVKNRDAVAARVLLEQGVDVDARQPDGATALLWAAQWDDLETARLLIRAGANVNAANDYGITPLLMACLNGSAVMIDALLKAGANPSLSQATGETPLMTAAKTGKLDAVTLLLGRGVDVNARETSGGQTALMWALSEQHLDVARALVQHGADVRGGSASGFTPLMFAVRQGDFDAVKLLLAQGADVNTVAADGVSALHVATVRGNAALAEYLMEQGADPNADGPGYAALHWAAWKSETFMTRDYHIDSGELSVLGGLPTREGKLGLIRALLAKGANVNVRLKRNTLPQMGHSYFMRGTIMGGGDLVGVTPFLLAAMVADVEVMRFLLANGADPTATTSNGTTALMLAAGLATMEWETTVPMSARVEAGKLCLELHDDINAANDEGNTALHATAFLGSSPVAQFLVDAGASVNPVNKKGQTPLQVAEGFVQLAAEIVHPDLAEQFRKIGGVRAVPADSRAETAGASDAFGANAPRR